MTRSRLIVLVSVVAVLLGFAALMAAADGGDDALARQSEPVRAAVAAMRPLPPGPPEIQGHGLILNVSRDELVSPKSTLIFIGTPVARGGSEPIGGDQAQLTGMTLTAHRVRFAVDRVLRGQPALAIDLIILDWEGLDVFEVGSRYLVFADHTEFGDGRIAGFRPRGYYQGAFRVLGDESAKNSRTDVSFSKPEIESDFRSVRR